MDLRQLSYFVAVAEEGQVTRAAVRMSVAQPAVSAKIQQLEHELGELLFYRGKHGVSLTDVGTALLPHARAALAATERGKDTIASLRGLLTGRLRLGISGPADQRLPQILGEFHRAHPRVKITLTDQLNETLLKALSDAAVDAAVVGVANHPLPPEICTRVIRSEPLVLGVAPGHPLSQRKTVGLEDLREWSIIALTPGGGLRTVLDDACRQLGFAPQIIVEASELGLLVELAAEGLGAAVLPRSAIEADRLAVIEITSPPLRRRTALAWNESAVTPAGRAFLTLAAARLGMSKGRAVERRPEAHSAS